MGSSTPSTRTMKFPRPGFSALAKEKQKGNKTIRVLFSQDNSGTLLKVDKLETFPVDQLLHSLDFHTSLIPHCSRNFISSCLECSSLFAGFHRNQSFFTCSSSSSFVDFFRLLGNLFRRSLCLGRSRFLGGRRIF